MAQAEAKAVKRYPGVKLSTRDEFVQSRVAGLSQILNLLYVLLALSVVVSLFGMINTLVLAVYERTRELGMLRAVGMPARQIRSMVRQKSVMTALIGAAIGLPLGIGLAAAVTSALSQYDIQFSVPLRTLLAFVVVALLAGVLAAVMPARRAGRLNVLKHSNTRVHRRQLDVRPTRRAFTTRDPAALDVPPAVQLEWHSCDRHDHCCARSQ